MEVIKKFPEDMDDRTEYKMMKSPAGRNMTVIKSPSGESMTAIKGTFTYVKRGANYSLVWLR